MASCSLAKECFKKFETGAAWKTSLSLLCRSLDDPDGAVSSSAESFLNESLPLGAVDRLTGAIRLLLNAEGQESFLRVGVALLMAGAEKSPQAEVKLFADPLSRECKFKVVTM